MKRRLLITTFRGQAQTFAYGLPDACYRVMGYW